MVKVYLARVVASVDCASEVVSDQGGGATNQCLDDSNDGAVTDDLTADVGCRVAMAQEDSFFEVPLVDSPKVLKSHTMHFQDRTHLHQMTMKSLLLSLSKLGTFVNHLTKLQDDEDHPESVRMVKNLMLEATKLLPMELHLNSSKTDGLLASDRKDSSQDAQQTMESAKVAKSMVKVTEELLVASYCYFLVNLDLA
jgi:hypothetical protein